MVETAGKNHFFSLLIFHLRSAGRLSQRVFLPLFSILFFLFFFFGPDFFYRLSAALFTGGLLSSAIPATTFLFVAAKIASQRISAGITGWIRHMPVSGTTLKYSSTAAVWISILPFMILPALFSAAASIKYGIDTGLFTAGLPPAGASVSLAALRVKRGFISAPLFIIASLCFTAIDPYLFLAGILIFTTALFLSGAIMPGKPSKNIGTGRFFQLALLWRALGIRLLFPYLLSFLPIPLVYLLFHNNGNNYIQSGIILRIGFSASLILFCSAWAQILSLRRPPWPWSRSLPRAGRQRVLSDAALLLYHLIPLFIIILAVDLATAFFTLLSLPALVFLSVYVNRKASENRLGAAGQLFGKTLIPALLFGIFGWASILYLALSPFTMSGAVGADNSLPVFNWEEKHHASAGDSLSWRQY